MHTVQFHAEYKAVESSRISGSADHDSCVGCDGGPCSFLHFTTEALELKCRVELTT